MATEKQARGRSHTNSKHVCRWARRTQRQQEARDRQASYQLLTTAQKLARLAPEGCQRERARLQQRLNQTHSQQAEAQA